MPAKGPSRKSNLVLIGMPGAGKSTVGVVLAKRLGYDFLDTDVAIQAREGRRLQEIINQDGLAALRRIEEEVLLELRVTRTVIATGGSAIYSVAAMESLKRRGTIVFLDVPLKALLHRVKDMDTRGLIMDPGETFADLYQKRLPLYRRWAEVVIAGREISVEEMVSRIAAPLDSA
ncbi:shikimate kinase [Desulfuromonas versatilis]|uniref:Shikimate kinase n=1 Tax=Desulfuromonas versatilis TaxID=2802975 RepID=A0ABN6E1D0_9BACT|nr:shikimate kinase [Desulfuromonas versatilis]BCR06111.1 shikimate kinase [Desulfuromonas versatilis]